MNEGGGGLASTQSPKTAALRSPKGKGGGTLANGCQYRQRCDHRQAWSKRNTNKPWTPIGNQNLARQGMVRQVRAGRIETGQVTVTRQVKKGQARHAGEGMAGQGRAGRIQTGLVHTSQEETS